jgi:hypothetical protein
VMILLFSIVRAPPAKIKHVMFVLLICALVLSRGALDEASRLACGASLSPLGIPAA